MEYFTPELLLSIPVLITCLTTMALLLVYLLQHNRHAPFIGAIPSVSILLPFYNEVPDILIKALDAIEQQNYPQSLQVVLIDDGSSNNSSKIATQWLSQARKHDYQLLAKAQNGGRKGYALDFALASKQLSGEVYIVIDSDTFIQADGIYELAKKLWSDDKYAAVCGYISPENHKSSLVGKLQYYEHIGFYGAIRAAQDHLGVVPVLAGAFVAHRASVVKAIGGWSEWLVEDISWAWKALAAGYKTGYAARAIATTQCPETHHGLFKQRRRWARGRVEAYTTAWGVSKRKGVLFTPWFAFSALQSLFPPTLLMLPLLMYFNIWLPLAITGLTLLMYTVFTMLYMNKHGQKIGVATRDILLVPLFTAVLELLTWLPNVLGYFDEISGRKKVWLTR
ncbi:MAG: glycosyltransferase [Proteobacteria bacterium]|nr:glycosyltransferase [Pseudomonadota bacterium]